MGWDAPPRDDRTTHPPSPPPLHKNSGGGAMSGERGKRKAAGDGGAADNGAKQNGNGASTLSSPAFKSPDASNGGGGGGGRRRSLRSSLGASAQKQEEEEGKGAAAGEHEMEVDDEEMTLTACSSASLSEGSGWKTQAQKRTAAAAASSASRASSQQGDDGESKARGQAGSSASSSSSSDGEGDEEHKANGGSSASKRPRRGAAAAATAAMTAIRVGEGRMRIVATVEEEEEEEEEDGGSKASASTGGKANGGKGKGAAAAAAAAAANGKEEGGGAGGKDTSRRDAMRRVAENRAAFFARADANDRAVPTAASQAAAAGGQGKGRVVKSSTPLPGMAPTPAGKGAGAGAGRAGGGGAKPEKEEWNGPFSIARRMLKQREAVKEARQQRLEGGQVEEGGQEGTTKIDWEPVVRKRRPIVYQPPTLAASCLRLLLEHVDAIESLGDVGTQVRYQFAEALAREGKLTPESVMKIVTPGLPELYLPDCKHVTEAALVEALERVASPPDVEEDADCDDGMMMPPPPPPHDGDEGGKALSPGAAPALRVLRLRWCGQAIGKKVIDAITKLGIGPSLEALELTGLYRLTDDALTSLLHACPNLRSLDLPYKSHVSPRLLEALVSANCARSLTSLSLAHCPDLSPEALASLRGLANMKELDLSGLPHLTDDVVAAVVEKNGASLSSLRLRGCQALTDQAMQHVGNHCRRLTSLDLGELYLVTPEALQTLFAIPECARSLQEVRLARAAVGDDTVLGLAMTAGTTLRHLDLNSATGAVTDATVAALVQFCGQGIEEVDLSFCRQVTDDALGYLADSCPRLKRMVLWGCTQVTDRFLKGHRREPGSLEIVGRAAGGSRVPLSKGLASSSS